MIRKSLQAVTTGAASFAAAAVLAGALDTGAAAAEDFYKGKTINHVVRSGPGGGNDFYARLVARHIGKHIPGNPDTIVTNMPGGGGQVAANYMANRAKKNGTEIAILSRDIAVVQRLGASGVRYDVRTLIPVGNATSSVYVWTVRKDVPVKTLHELKKHGGTLKFSGTGAGTASVQSIQFLKSDGFPVESISGYDGTAERVLAIVRGEVHGTSGSYGSLQTPIRDEGFRVIGRIGKHPDLMNVPDLREAVSSENRALASLMAVPSEMGRPFFTTPEVPADRVKLLRGGFKGALEDPQLLKEANKAKRAISWSSAEDMEALIKDIMNASDKVIADFKAL